MSKLINFRDFGGHKTQSGKHVKKGLFYRCGSYRDLTTADREYLRSLNLKNLFDYREEHEVDRDELRETFADEVYTISASAHLNSLHQSGHQKPVTEDIRHLVLSSQAMVAFYKLLPFNNPAYQNLFKVLLKEDAVPMIHNCTAGKDRTGVGSALILLALGVSEESIMSDYMLSMNAYDQIFDNEATRLTDPANKEKLIYFIPGLVVMPRYLESALTAILAKYETYENYFEHEFGLGHEEIAALRERYTE